MPPYSQNAGDASAYVTAWRPLAYHVSQLLYSYQILEAVLNCLKCSLRWKIFIFFPLLQSDSTAIFLGRSGRNWSFSLSNLQTNNSKQLLNAWKAHSSEKLVSSHLRFSVRPGFHQCRFDMWLKELWNILAVLFHLRCSSGGLRFGRTKCGNHALCPASKAFTGQTIVSTQQTAQKYQICAMELLNQLAVCLRQTA